MKITITLLLLFTTISKAFSQINESGSYKFPPDSILLKKAQYLVDNYKVAVILAVNCKNNYFNLESILNKFTKDAIIEVSSVNSDHIRKKTVTEYFSRLRDFCRGINYDSIDISFPSDIIKPNEIKKEYSNVCSVNKDIIQVFKAYRNNNSNPVYCDVTIKRIWVVFVANQDGSYSALINRVSVLNTQNCFLN